ncbi:MAG: tail fiber domain-containing protein [Verrucomicrobiales bacterium]|nr:tail fiber domain-containing protein [Verrucomicrobiales bacterium]
MNPLSFARWFADPTTPPRDAMIMTLLSHALPAPYRPRSGLRPGFEVGAMLCVVTLLFALWGVAIPAQAASSPPSKMSYQGFLVDGLGNPLGSSTGGTNYNVIFRIFVDEEDTGSGAAPLWSEQQFVTVDRGNFSVILGDGIRVGSEFHGSLSEVFAGRGDDLDVRYLEITVDQGGGSRLTLKPRLRLLPSPYAFLAAHAATASQLVTPTGAPFLAFSSVDSRLVITNTARFGVTEMAEIKGASSTDPLKVGLANPAQALKVTESTSGSDLFSLSAASGLRLNTLLDLGDSTGPTKIALFRNSEETYGLGILGDGQYLFHLGGRSYERFTFRDQAAGTDLMRIGANGDVALPGGNLIVGGAKIPAGITVGRHGHGLGSYDPSGNGTDARLQFEVPAGHRFAFRSTTAGSEVVTIRDNGNLGIRTINPSFPLDVNSVFNPGLLDVFLYGYSGVGQDIGFRKDRYNVSIRASGHVWAAGLLLSSDERIKRNVATSESAHDLDLIGRLRVTDFNYRDPVVHGPARHKGFIAQEVARLIPDAVSAGPGFIPDILTAASTVEHSAEHRTLTLGFEKAHGLRAGEKIRLVTDADQRDVVVAKVPSERTLVLEQWESEPAKAFVYGREVSDFLSVDYDRIFVTGISAIQELHRLVETQAHRLEELERQSTQVSRLQSEVAALKSQLALQATERASFEARFQALEGRVTAAAARGDEASADPDRVLAVSSR